MLAGQSNMSGRGTTQEGDNPIGDRIWTITGSNGREASVHPIHPTLGTGTPDFGLGGQFALDMLAGTYQQIILVPRAAGGSSAGDWQKGDAAGWYDNAINDVQNLYLGGDVTAVLWHQGETDALDEDDANAYQGRLEQMISDMRSDLGLPNLPFVVGELVPSITRDYADTVNSALSSVASGDSKVALVSSEGTTDVGDDLHFDRDSLITLGSRYATALKGIL